MLVVSADNREPARALRHTDGFCVQRTARAWYYAAVEPRLDVITLAVADLERALAFYRGLGLQSKGIVGSEWTDEMTGANGAIAMFKLDGGLILNLYPRAELAKDSARRAWTASKDRATAKPNHRDNTRSIILSPDSTSTHLGKAGRPRATNSVHSSARNNEVTTQTYGNET